MTRGRTDCLLLNRLEEYEGYTSQATAYLSLRVAAVIAIALKVVYNVHDDPG